MKREQIKCRHWGGTFGVYLPITQKNNEIIENTRRIWRALRRELGETETLIEDFKTQGVEMLRVSGYVGTVDGDFILQNVILY
tara:strand:- start:583 stop:831 length:249 start_codon:yes stop_codon:yes gene_type:complete